MHDALTALSTDISSRRAQLSDAYTLAALRSDIAETDAWIDERMKAIRAEVYGSLERITVVSGMRRLRYRLQTDRQGQLTSIEDKMKRLQRHQAFEVSAEP